MWEKFITHVLEYHRGKAIGIIAGLIAGILIVVYGFWKTLLIILCIVIGYGIGKSLDENGRVDEWVQRVFRNK